MNILTEETSIIQHFDRDDVQRPRSFQWQLFQALLYLIASLLFVTGSSMFFTSIFRPHPNTLIGAGWLFTVGSAIFLFADLQEWWDHRTGYCFSYKERQNNYSLDRSSSSNDENPLTIECNVFGSMIGIAFYFAGSILFIPIFQNYALIGVWFFIFGTTISYSSTFWKLYRTGCQNSDRKFHFRLLLQDIPVLAMDIFSIVGNVTFFAGSILFLPYINLSDGIENRAAALFVFGSACFVLSSLVLLYTICRPSR